MPARVFRCPIVSADWRKTKFHRVATCLWAFIYRRVYQFAAPRRVVFSFCCARFAIHFLRIFEIPPSFALAPGALPQGISKIA